MKLKDKEAGAKQRKEIESEGWETQAEHWVKGQMRSRTYAQFNAQMEQLVRTRKQEQAVFCGACTANPSSSAHCRCTRLSANTDSMDFYLFGPFWSLSLQGEDLMWSRQTQGSSEDMRTSPVTETVTAWCCIHRRHLPHFPPLLSPLFPPSPFPSFLKILLEEGLPLLAPLSSAHDLCGPWWHTQTWHRHYSACPSVLPLYLWAAAARPDPLWSLAFLSCQLPKPISTGLWCSSAEPQWEWDTKRCSCPVSGKPCFVTPCSDAETHSWGFWLLSSPVLCSVQPWSRVSQRTFCEE